MVLKCLAVVYMSYQTAHIMANLQKGGVVGAHGNEGSVGVAYVEIYTFSIYNTGLGKNTWISH